MISWIHLKDEVRNLPDYIRELYLLESESDRLPFREEADHRAASL